MKAADRARVFATLARHIDPRSELDFGNPFELLVAVVLSAQATDRSVNLATARLFPVARTPAALLALGEAGLTPYIRAIGLYRTKARNLLGLCRQLLERHGGEVPGERSALEALPGVGRKTASVVLNLAFGQPVIAVDTHVQRVATRLGLVTTTRPDDTERELERLVPAEHLRHAHHYLILHGRHTCTARAPKCDACPVARWCPSRETVG